MDTGFNYYHGADPSEYDLVLSNSEGGLARLLELGARRAEAVFWARRPRVLRAAAGREGARRLLLRLRRQVPARVDGGDGRRAEPRRAARSTSRSAGATSRATSAAARLLGDVPFNVFARAISAARINLNVTRRSHATVPRLVDLPAVRARLGGRRDRLQPARGDRALVRAGQRAASSSTTRTRRSPRTASCSTTRRRPRRWVPRARERVLDEHTYAHRARQLLALLGLEAAGARVVTADRIASRSSPRSTRRGRSGGVVDEIRAFDPAIRRRRRRRRLDGRDGRGRRATRARPSSGCRSTSASARAVQTGFKYALEHGYDVAVRLDGDGQHDPAELSEAARPPLERDEADVVIGSRFAEDEERLPAAACAAARDHLVRPARLAAHPPARDRHDVRASRRSTGGGSRSSPPTTRATTPRWRRPCSSSSTGCGSSRCR